MQDLIQRLTTDLRLALLVLGALVITLLILWELLQRWRARKADGRHVTNGLDAEDVLLKGGAAAEPPRRAEVTPRIDPPRRADEVELDLPRMSARDDFDERWAANLSTARAVHAQKGHAEDELPDEGVIGPAREVVTPAESARSEAISGESVSAEPVSADPVSATPISAAPVLTESAPPVRIEWPPEEQRRVMALRVVGKGGERFTGASLRQALQGEGFVWGEMEIFHRPVADGRVLMSAASLTQPGTFNLDTMDASLYRGLNLFAVLPGPLPGREAVDKLLLVGHTLAQRVKGELLDGRGQPLTESRLADMRREAGSIPG